MFTWTPLLIQTAITAYQQITIALLCRRRAFNSWCRECLPTSKCSKFPKFFRWIWFAALAILRWDCYFSLQYARKISRTQFLRLRGLDSIFWLKKLFTGVGWGFYDVLLICSAIYVRLHHLHFHLIHSNAYHLPLLLELLQLCPSAQHFQAMIAEMISIQVITIGSDNIHQGYKKHGPTFQRIRHVNWTKC